MNTDGKYYDFTKDQSLGNKYDREPTPGDKFYGSQTIGGSSDQCPSCVQQTNCPLCGRIYGWPERYFPGWGRLPYWQYRPDFSPVYCY